MYLNKILPVFALASLLAACSPGADNGADDQSNTSLEAPAEQATATDPGTVDQSATPAGAAQTFKIDGSSAKSGAQLAVNPAHGEPGHRCDIDVGAPLNSTATKPAPDAVKSSPAAASPTVKPATIGAPTISAPAAGTSGKLNPAHGEPGHKCEIAVGAPL